MKALAALLADRRRRQRGSVLSGVLIMVAMLSILVGALTTELSDSFLLSQTLGSRSVRQATMNSAVELALYQLDNRTVPPVCARDAPPTAFTSLNGASIPAQATSRCIGIVPDQSSGLAAGTYLADGVHEVASGHNAYVVGNQAGTLYSYTFGTTTAQWSVDTAGPITGPVLATPAVGSPPDVALLVPDAAQGSCGSHCVQLYEESTGGTPSFTCAMSAGATVATQPAIEVSPSGFAPNFPGYAFFGDTAGDLYVYDSSTEGSCALEADAGGLGGAVVGPLLVYTGTNVSRGRNSSVISDVFVTVSSSSATQLQHWQYAEAGQGNAQRTKTLTRVSSLTIAVGGRAFASNPSSSGPVVGSTIQIAVAGGTGRLGIGRIAVSSTRSGPTYTISGGASGQVAGNVAAAPYWSSCTCGSAIGVGSTNGSFFLLDTSLNPIVKYSGQAPIHTVPVADGNGDWYFGADDGSVYDVEIASSGQQMFAAARFQLGGSIRSSPVAGPCSTGPCIYFGSSTAGAYFVRLGGTRLMELHACVTASPQSVNCSGSPSLWVRAEIGLPSVVGGKGISVQGWSYYSP